MIRCLRLTAPVQAKNLSKGFTWMKLNIPHIVILCIRWFCNHRMALFTKVYHKHGEMQKEGNIMSHLDCGVYASCVSKEHSVQTVYFLLKHTAHLTEGNILRQTCTGGGEGSWGCWVQGGGGQGSQSLLLQRAHGSTSHTHPLLSGHGSTRRGNRDNVQYFYDCIYECMIILDAHTHTHTHTQKLPPDTQ